MKYWSMFLKQQTINKPNVKTQVVATYSFRVLQKKSIFGALISFISVEI